MKRTVLIFLLLVGIMPLGSCSWIKKREEAKKERAAAAEAAAPEALPAPAPESRWRRWFKRAPKAERWVEISFPDPALSRAVRNAIHRPQKGKLYRSDVEYLEVLIIPGWNVRDLAGMENCRGLTKLDLSWNPQIHDLTPLKDLTKLRELYLRNLAVKDLTPLAGLTALTTLDLANNQISDLRPLAGLNDLAELDLSMNQIQSLEPLRNLRRLTKLGLYQNKVADLAPLAGLLALSELNLTYNNISDLDPLVQNSQNGGLGYNDIIYIFGNNLGTSALNRQIPLLEKRGAAIHQEFARYKER